MDFKVFLLFVLFFSLRRQHNAAMIVRQSHLDALVSVQLESVHAVEVLVVASALLDLPVLPAILLA